MPKNGSFGFAKGQLLYWVNPNVPFVLLAIIEFLPCPIPISSNLQKVSLPISRQIDLSH